MNNLIEITNLNKEFNLSNNQELLIFDNLFLSITNNSITSIIGPSGCGKSTLLNILGLLDSNFRGKYLFEGNIVSKMNSNNLSNIRDLFGHKVSLTSTKENKICYILPCS